MLHMMFSFPNALAQNRYITYCFFLSILKMRRTLQPHWAARLEHMYQAVQPVVHLSLPFLSYHLHGDIQSCFSHIKALIWNGSLQSPALPPSVHSLHLISLPSLLLIIFFCLLRSWASDVLNWFCSSIFKRFYIRYHMLIQNSTNVVYPIAYLYCLLSKCPVNLNGFMLSAGNDSPYPPCKWTSI